MDDDIVNVWQSHGNYDDIFSVITREWQMIRVKLRFFFWYHWWKSIWKVSIPAEILCYYRFNSLINLISFFFRKIKLPKLHQLLNCVISTKNSITILVHSLWGTFSLLFENYHDALLHSRH